MAVSVILVENITGSTSDPSKATVIKLPSEMLANMSMLLANQRPTVEVT
jgi:hypothetical protein